MMHWTPQIWAIYILASIIIGLAYYVISFTRLLNRQDPIGVLDFLFIFLCGTGHIIHSIGMYLLAHHYPWEFITFMIIFIDAITAGVSAFTAKFVYSIRKDIV